MKSNSGGKAVRYNKWGYIFLIPFIVVFVIFQLVPLVNTIYNSFFENYMSGLTQVGPRFVGLDNYKALFSSGDIWTYFKNTMVLWIMCFIPQIFLSLLLCSIDYYLIFLSVLVLHYVYQCNQIKRTVTIRIYRDSKYKPVKKLEQSGARNASNLVWNVQQSDHRCLLSSALYIFLNHDRICDPCV